MTFFVCTVAAEAITRPLAALRTAAARAAEEGIYTPVAHRDRGEIGATVGAVNAMGAVLNRRGGTAPAAKEENP